MLWADPVHVGGKCAGSSLGVLPSGPGVCCANCPCPVPFPVWRLVFLCWEMSPGDRHKWELSEQLCWPATEQGCS